MKPILKNSTKINIVLLAILIINLVLLSLFLNPIQSQAAILINGKVCYAEGGEEVGLNILNPLGGTSDITSLVKNILNFLWKLAFAIAPILIVYAGFLYITSAGNEEKVKIAQKALTWAIIGFAVILIASSIPAIIQGFLSGESNTTEESEETNNGF